MKSDPQLIHGEGVIEREFQNVGMNDACMPIPSRSFLGLGASAQKARIIRICKTYLRYDPIILGSRTRQDLCLFLHTL